MSENDKTLLVRLFKENFRKHVGWYSAAIAAMLVVAGTTSLSAWIMRDIVNSVYLKQGFDVVLEIAFAVAAIFIVKGLATFVQSYYLSKAGNSIVAEQQRKDLRSASEAGRFLLSESAVLGTAGSRYLQCTGGTQCHRYDCHIVRA